MDGMYLGWWDKSASIIITNYPFACLSPSRYAEPSPCLLGLSIRFWVASKLQCFRTMMKVFWRCSGSHPNYYLPQWWFPFGSNCIFLLYTGFGQLHVVGRVWLEGFRLRCRLVWSLSTFYPLYNIYNFLVISDMPQSSSNVKVKNWRMLGVLIKEFGLFPLIDYKKLWMSNIIKLEEIFVTQQGKFCRTKLTEFQYCQK